MPSVAVIGGGVSGLSTAYYLATRCSVPISKILLLESSAQCGGWVGTDKNAGTGALFEKGPRSIRRAGVPGFTTLQLVDELGLNEDVIGIDSSHPGAKNRFLYCNKSVCALPNNLLSLFSRHPPFSKSFALLGWREPFQASATAEDESIHDFISRRIHPEFADYMISAVCRGVFAGSSRELSVRSCLPLFWNMDKEHGSIFKAMLRKEKAKLPPGNDLVKTFDKNKWSIWSLKGGLQQLTDKLVDVLHEKDCVEIRTNTACKHIKMTPRGTAEVTTDAGEVIEVDHVVSTAYAAHTADMLPEHAHLASMLRTIPAVTVAVVSAEFPGAALTLPGFGHLVPTTEDTKSLGIIYESSIWPQHDRAGDTPTTRVTIMLGGAWFRDWFGDENECCAEDFIPHALQEFREQLGISVQPLNVVASLQKDCIPQYRIGHYKILEYLDEYLGSSPLPLHLTGSSYRGVSVNDCVLNGKLTAEQVLAEIEENTLIQCRA